MSQTQPQNDNGGSLSLFAKQEKIYPKRVWGRYRKLKWVAMILTLGVYYLAPS